MRSQLATYNNGSHDGLTWFILAQAMGVITILIEFLSYQIKDQRKYLLSTSIANVFWALMFIFMGLYGSLLESVIMSLAAVFGVVRGLTFYFIFAKKTRRRKILGRVFLYVSLAIVAGAAIFTLTQVVQQDAPRQQIFQQAIIQGVGIIVGILFVIGQYQKNKHLLRIFVVMYATVIMIGSTPLNLFEGDIRWHPMGITIEVAKILSVIVFYIVLIAATVSRKKRERLGEAAPPKKPLPQWVQKATNKKLIKWLMTAMRGVSRETEHANVAKVFKERHACLPIEEAETADENTTAEIENVGENENDEKLIKEGSDGILIDSDNMSNKQK